jgi:hypothetical protein
VPPERHDLERLPGQLGRAQVGETLLRCHTRIMTHIES